MNISINNTTHFKRSLKWAVAAFFFVQGLSFAAWASRIPDIKNMLHLSEGGLGTVLLALPLGLLASLPISGWMVTRYGSQRMVFIGALFYAITLTCIGLVSSTLQLVVTLFIFGLWGNLTNIAVNTQAVEVEQSLGKSIMASFHGLWSLAGFISASIGSAFISWQIPPSVHFIFIAIAAIAIILIANRHSFPDQGSKKSGAKQPSLWVKPDKELLILGLIGFCAMVCEGAMFDWSGVYFQEVVEAPTDLTTLGYVAFMATMTGGRFAGDWLANRLGRTKIIKISGLLMGSGLIIAIIFPYIETATFGFLLVGLGVSSVVPLVYGATGRSKSLSAGMALAAVSSISFVGFLIGPPLIGIVAQYSSLSWSFLIVAILASCASLLASKSKLIA
ncbi:fucose permease [Dyadobacter jejuensis]|uniref:Fucose permease n=1 Tax=Dyadobacter jejuensis TaxID=1082580 RepID=A0A316ANF5_9BACT|nr:MFS transporter [Dyadobacter jejuensis]PWJ59021.1 fucose permease [Dyadobacter jejuensis]